MTANQQQLLLQRLTSIKDGAFSADAPNISLIRQIFFELSSLPRNEKPFFRELVQEIKNRMFESGANLPGLDLIEFEDGPQEPIVEIALANAEPLSTAISPTESLIEIVNCLKEELPTLKNYFFLRLQTNGQNFQPLIVYEDGCHYQPLKKGIEDKYGHCICITIEQLKNELERGNHSGESFIALLVISTKVNQNDKIEQRENVLKSIFEYFDEVYQLFPKKFVSLKAGDVITTSDVEALLEEIKYVSSSFLTNAELSNDEEKIIKKLFRHANCPILEYRVLKGGKSGSKVLEIHPQKGYANSVTRRFIVKFSQFDDKRKISLEAKRFGDHIEHFAIPNYSKTHERNATTEAIKYIYASSNNISTSYSFSEIISKVDNQFYPDRKSIVEDIFASAPFEPWRQSLEQERKKISDLYSDYIKPEKFFANVKKILGIDDVQLAKEKIYSSFNKIWQLEINTKSKVCHGDLHSENIFKDGSGIYLIDFGFTDKRHAVIDHTSLECSIKFKHVPFYIELKTLLEIEEQLLSDDSFNATFEIKTVRKDVAEYFELVKLIRLSSLPNINDENSKIDYLISLFLITCRNAQYPDLNQLYAFKSAEMLGEKILPLLD